MEGVSDETFYFSKSYSRACSSSEQRSEIPGVEDFEIFHDRDGAEFHSTYVKVQKEPSIKSVIVSLQPSLPAVLWPLVVPFDNYK